MYLTKALPIDFICAFPQMLRIGQLDSPDEVLGLTTSSILIGAKSLVNLPLVFTEMYQAVLDTIGVNRYGTYETEVVQSSGAYRSRLGFLNGDDTISLTREWWPLQDKVSKNRLGL
jgi:hypothetical protein